MGKCSSKEKRGRKLVTDKGNKGAYASISSSGSSSPRASQAQAPTTSTLAQATPTKILEVTQAVPTPTISPAKLKEAKKSRREPVAISTKIEDPAEATTSQSLEEPELFFGEEVQTVTSSSAPTGLRRRNVAIKKETNQLENPPPDLRSESFHDAIDDLPDFPVLDSSFDESEFRTPIGRLSTDSSYSSDKSSSCSEKERAVTSHYGFSPKTKESLATSKQSTRESTPSRQQLDILRSGRDEKPRDGQRATDKNTERTYQMNNLFSATESPASNQENTVSPIGIVLPIHTREEHFAAPSGPPPLVSCKDGVVQTKQLPTEAGKFSSLLQETQPRQVNHPGETPKDMDVGSLTESFEHIDASDANFSEDDMHPRKSDSSYVMLGNDKTETATEDSSPCTLEAVMIEQPEGIADHLDTSQPPKEEPSKQSEAAYKPTNTTASDRTSVEQKGQAEVNLRKSLPVEYETSEKSPRSLSSAPTKAAFVAIPEQQADATPTVMVDEPKEHVPIKDETTKTLQALKVTNVAQTPQHAQDIRSSAAVENTEETMDKEANEAADNHELESSVPMEDVGESTKPGRVINFTDRTIAENFQSQDPELLSHADALQDDAMQQPECLTLQENVEKEKAHCRECTPDQGLHQEGSRLAPKKHQPLQIQPLSSVDEHKEREAADLEPIPVEDKKLQATQREFSQIKDEPRKEEGQELYNYTAAFDEHASPTHATALNMHEKDMPILDGQKEEKPEEPGLEAKKADDATLEHSVQDETIQDKDQKLHDLVLEPDKNVSPSDNIDINEHQDDLDPQLEEKGLDQDASPTSKDSQLVNKKMPAAGTKEEAGKVDDTAKEQNEQGHDNITEKLEVLERDASATDIDIIQGKLQGEHELPIEPDKNNNPSQPTVVHEQKNDLLEPQVKETAAKLGQEPHQEDFHLPLDYLHPEDEEQLVTGMDKLKEVQESTVPLVNSKDDLAIDHDKQDSQLEAIKGDTFGTQAESIQEGDQPMHEIPDITANDDHEEDLLEAPVRKLKEKPRERSQQEESSFESKEIGEPAKQEEGAMAIEEDLEEKSEGPVSVSDVADALKGEATPAEDIIKKADIQQAEAVQTTPWTEEQREATSAEDIIKKADIQQAEALNTTTSTESIDTEESCSMGDVLKMEGPNVRKEAEAINPPCSIQEAPVDIEPYAQEKDSDVEKTRKTKVPEPFEKAVEEESRVAAEIEMQESTDKQGLADSTEACEEVKSADFQERKVTDLGDGLQEAQVAKRPEGEGVSRKKEILEAPKEPRDTAYEGETNLTGGEVTKPDIKLDHPEPTELLILDSEEQPGIADVSMPNNQGVKTEPEALTTKWSSQAAPMDTEESFAKDGNVQEVEKDVPQELQEKTFEGDFIPSAEMGMQPSTDDQALVDSKEPCEEVTAGDVQETKIADIAIEASKNLFEATDENPTTYNDDSKHEVPKLQVASEPEGEGVSKEKQVLDVVRESEDTACQGESGPATNHNNKPDIHPDGGGPTEPFIPEQELRDTEVQPDMTHVPTTEDPDAAPKAKETTYKSLTGGVSVEQPHQESVLVENEPCAQQGGDIQKAQQDIASVLQEKAIEGDFIPATEVAMQPATDDQVLLDNKEIYEVKAGDGQENQATDILVEPQTDVCEETSTCIVDNNDDVSETLIGRQPDQEGDSQGKEILEEAIESQDTTCEGESTLTAEEIEKSDIQPADEEPTEHFVQEQEVKDSGDQRYMPNVLKTNTPDGATEAEPITTVSLTQGMLVDIPVPCAQEKDSKVQEREVDITTELQENPSEGESNIVDEMAIQPPPTEQALLHIKKKPDEVEADYPKENEVTSDGLEPPTDAGEETNEKETGTTCIDENKHDLLEPSVAEQPDQESVSTQKDVLSVDIEPQEDSNVQERKVDVTTELREKPFEGESNIVDEMAIQPPPTEQALVHIKDKSDEVEADYPTENEVTGNGLDPPTDAGEETNEKETGTTCIDENKHDLLEPSVAEQPDQESVSMQKDVLGVDIEPQDGASKGESALEAKDAEKLDIQQAEAESEEISVQEQELKETEEQSDMADLHKSEAPHTPTEAEVNNTSSLTPGVPVDIEEPRATQGDVPGELQEEFLERESLEAAEMAILPLTDNQAMVDTKETREEVKAGDVQDNEVTDIAVEPPKVRREDPSSEKDVTCIDEHKHDPSEPEVEEKPLTPGVSENTEVPNAQEEDGIAQETKVYLPTELQEKAAEGESIPLDKMAMQPSIDDQVLVDFKETSDEIKSGALKENEITDIETEPPVDADEEQNEKETISLDEHQHELSGSQVAEKQDWESAPKDKDMLEVPIEPQERAFIEEYTLAAEGNKMPDTQEAKAKPARLLLQEQELIDTEQWNMPNVPKIETPETQTELLETSEEVKAGTSQETEVTDEALEPPKDAGEEQHEKETISNDELKQSLIEPQVAEQPDHESVSIKQDLLDVAIGPQDTAPEGESTPKAEDTKKADMQKPEEDPAEPLIQEQKLLNTQEQCNMPGVPKAEAPDPTMEAEVENADSSTRGDIEEPCAQEGGGNVPETQGDVATDMPQKLFEEESTLRTEMALQPSTDNQAPMDSKNTSEDVNGGNSQENKVTDIAVEPKEPVDTYATFSNEQEQNFPAPQKQQPDQERVPAEKEVLEAALEPQETAIEEVSSLAAEDIIRPTSQQAETEPEGSLIQEQELKDSEEQCNKPDVLKKEASDAVLDDEATTTESFTRAMPIDLKNPCAQEEGNSQEAQEHVAAELKEKAFEGQSILGAEMAMPPFTDDQEFVDKVEGLEPQKEQPDQERVSAEKELLEAAREPQDTAIKEESSLAAEDILKPDIQQVEAEPAEPLIQEQELTDSEEQCDKPDAPKKEAPDAAVDDEATTTESFTRAMPIDIANPCAQEEGGNSQEGEEDVEADLTEKAFKEESILGAEMSMPPSTDDQAFLDNEERCEPQKEQPDQESVSAEKEVLEAAIKPQDTAIEEESSLAAEDIIRPDIQQVETEPAEPLIQEQELTDSEEQCDKPDVPKKEAPDAAVDHEATTTESFTRAMPIDIENPCAQEEGGNSQEGEEDVAAELKEKAFKGESIFGAEMAIPPFSDDQAFVENEERCEPQKEKPDQERFSAENEVLEAAIEPQDTAYQEKSSLAAEDILRPDIQQVETEPAEPLIQEQKLTDSEEQCDKPDVLGKEAPDVAIEDEATTIDLFTRAMPIDLENPCAQEGDNSQEGEEDVAAKLKEKAFQGESILGAEMAMPPCTDDQALVDNEERCKVISDDAREEEGPAKTLLKEPNQNPTTCIDDRKNGLPQTRFEREPDQENIYQEEQVLEVAPNPQVTASLGDSCLAADEIKKPDIPTAETEPTQPSSQKQEPIESEEQGGIPEVSETEAPDAATEAETMVTDSLTQKVPIATEDPCAKQKDNDVQETGIGVSTEPQEKSNEGESIQTAEMDIKHFSPEQASVGVKGTSEDVRLGEIQENEDTDLGVKPPAITFKEPSGDANTTCIDDHKHDLSEPAVAERPDHESVSIEKEELEGAIEPGATAKEADTGLTAEPSIQEKELIDNEEEFDKHNDPKRESTDATADVEVIATESSTRGMPINIEEPSAEEGGNVQEAEEGVTPELPKEFLEVECPATKKDMQLSTDDQDLVDSNETCEGAKAGDGQEPEFTGTGLEPSNDLCEEPNLSNTKCNIENLEDLPNTQEGREQENDGVCQGNEVLEVATESPDMICEKESSVAAEDIKRPVTQPAKEEPTEFFVQEQEVEDRHSGLPDVPKTETPNAATDTPAITELLTQGVPMDNEVPSAKEGDTEVQRTELDVPTEPQEKAIQGDSIHLPEMGMQQSTADQALKDNNETCDEVKADDIQKNDVTDCAIEPAIEPHVVLDEKETIRNVEHKHDLSEPQVAEQPEQESFSVEKDILAIEPQETSSGGEPSLEEHIKTPDDQQAKAESVEPSIKEKKDTEELCDIPDVPKSDATDEDTEAEATTETLTQAVPVDNALPCGQEEGDDVQKAEEDPTVEQEKAFEESIPAAQTAMEPSTNDRAKVDSDEIHEEVTPGDFQANEATGVEPPKYASGEPEEHPITCADENKNEVPQNQMERDPHQEAVSQEEGVQEFARESQPKASEEESSLAAAADVKNLDIQLAEGEPTAFFVQKQELRDCEEQCSMPADAKMEASNAAAEAELLTTQPSSKEESINDEEPCAQEEDSGVQETQVGVPTELQEKSVEEEPIYTAELGMQPSTAEQVLMDNEETWEEVKSGENQEDKITKELLVEPPTEASEEPNKDNTDTTCIDDHQQNPSEPPVAELPEKERKIEQKVAIEPEVTTIPEEIKNLDIHHREADPVEHLIQQQLIETEEPNVMPDVPKMDVAAETRAITPDSLIPEVPVHIEEHCVQEEGSYIQAKGDVVPDLQEQPALEGKFIPAAEIGMQSSTDDHVVVDSSTDDQAILASKDTCEEVKADEALEEESTPAADVALQQSTTDEEVVDSPGTCEELNTGDVQDRDIALEPTKDLCEDPKVNLPTCIDDNKDDRPESQVAREPDKKGVSQGEEVLEIARESQETPCARQFTLPGEDVQYSDIQPAEGEPTDPFMQEQELIDSEEQCSKPDVPKRKALDTATEAEAITTEPFPQRRSVETEVPCAQEENDVQEMQVDGQAELQENDDVQETQVDGGTELQEKALGEDSNQAIERSIQQSTKEEEFVKIKETSEKVKEGDFQENKVTDLALEPPNDEAEEKSTMCIDEHKHDPSESQAEEQPDKETNFMEQDLQEVTIEPQGMASEGKPGLAAGVTESHQIQKESAEPGEPLSELSDTEEQCHMPNIAKKDAQGVAESMTPGLPIHIVEPIVAKEESGTVEKAEGDPMAELQEKGSERESDSAAEIPVQPFTDDQALVDSAEPCEDVKAAQEKEVTDQAIKPPKNLSQEPDENPSTGSDENKDDLVVKEHDQEGVSQEKEVLEVAREPQTSAWGKESTLAAEDIQNPDTPPTETEPTEPFIQQQELMDSKEQCSMPEVPKDAPDAATGVEAISTASMTQEVPLDNEEPYGKSENSDFQETEVDIPAELQEKAITYEEVKVGDVQVNEVTDIAVEPAKNLCEEPNVDLAPSIDAIKNDLPETQVAREPAERDVSQGQEVLEAAQYPQDPACGGEPTQPAHDLQNIQPAEGELAEPFTQEQELIDNEERCSMPDVSKTKAHAAREAEAITAEQFPPEVSVETKVPCAKKENDIYKTQVDGQAELQENVLEGNSNQAIERDIQPSTEEEEMVEIKDTSKEVEEGDNQENKVTHLALEPAKNGAEEPNEKTPVYIDEHKHDPSESQAEEQPHKESVFMDQDLQEFAKEPQGMVSERIPVPAAETLEIQEDDTKPAEPVESLLENQELTNIEEQCDMPNIPEMDAQDTADALTPGLPVHIEERPAAQEQGGDVQEAEGDEPDVQEKAFEECDPADGIPVQPFTNGQALVDSEETCEDVIAAQEKEVIDPAIEPPKNLCEEPDDNPTDDHEDNLEMKEQDHEGVSQEKEVLEVAREPQTTVWEGDSNMATEDIKTPDITQAQTKPTEPFIQQEELMDGEGQCILPEVPKAHVTDAATEVEAISTEFLTQEVPLDNEEPCAKTEDMDVQKTEADIPAELQGKAITSEEVKAGDFQDEVTDTAVEPAKDLCKEPNVNLAACIDDIKDDLPETQVAREPDQKDVSQGEEVLKAAQDSQVTACGGEPTLPADDIQKHDIELAEEEPTEPFIQGQELIDSEEQCSMPDVPKTKAPDAAAEAEAITIEPFPQKISVETEVPCAQNDDDQQTQVDGEAELQEKDLEGDSNQAFGTSIQPSTEQEVVAVEENPEDDKGGVQENNVTDLALEPPTDEAEERSEKSTLGMDEHKHDPSVSQAEEQPENESVSMDQELLEIAIEPQGEVTDIALELPKDEAEEPSTVGIDEHKHDPSVPQAEENESVPMNQDLQDIATEPVVGNVTDLVLEPPKDEAEEPREKSTLCLDEQKHLKSKAEEQPDNERVSMDQDLQEVAIEPQAMAAEGTAEDTKSLEIQEDDKETAESLNEKQPLTDMKEQCSMPNIAKMDAQDVADISTPGLPVHVEEPPAAPEEGGNVQDVAAELQEKAFEEESDPAAEIPVQPFTDGQTLVDSTETRENVNAAQEKEVTDPAIEPPNNLCEEPDEKHTTGIDDNKDDPVLKEQDQEGISQEKKVLEVAKEPPSSGDQAIVDSQETCGEAKTPVFENVKLANITIQPPKDLCEEPNENPSTPIDDNKNDLSESEVDQEGAFQEKEVLEVARELQYTPCERESSLGGEEFETFDVQLDKEDPAEPFIQEQKLIDNKEQGSMFSVPKTEAQDLATKAEAITTKTSTQGVCAETEVPGVKEGDGNVHESEVDVSVELQEKAVEGESIHTTLVGMQPSNLAQVSIDPQDAASEKESSLAADNGLLPDIQQTEAAHTEPLVQDKQFDTLEQCDMPEITKMEAPDSATEAEATTTEPVTEKVPLHIEESCAQEEDKNVQIKEGDDAAELQEKAVEKKFILAPELAMQPSTDYQAIVESKDTCEEVKGDDVQQKEITDIAREPPKDLCKAPNENPTTCIDVNEDDLSETQVAKEPDQEGMSQGVQVPDVTREPQAMACEGNYSLAAENVKNPNIQPAKGQPTEPFIEKQELLDTEKQYDEPQIPESRYPDAETGTKALTTEYLNREVPLDIEESTAQEGDVPKNEVNLPTELQDKSIEGEFIQTHCAEVEADDLNAQEVTGMVVEPAIDTDEEPKQKDTHTTCIGEHSLDLLELGVAKQPDQESGSMEEEEIEAPQDSATEGESSLAAETIAKPEIEQTNAAPPDHFIQAQELKDSEQLCDMPYIPKMQAPDASLEADAKTTESLTGGVAIGSEDPHAQEEGEEAEGDVAAKPQEKTLGYTFTAADTTMQRTTDDQALVDSNERGEAKAGDAQENEVTNVAVGASKDSFEEPNENPSTCIDNKDDLSKTEVPDQELLEVAVESQALPGQEDCSLASDEPDITQAEGEPKKPFYQEQQLTDSEQQCSIFEVPKTEASNAATLDKAITEKELLEVATGQPDTAFEEKSSLIADNITMPDIEPAEAEPAKTSIQQQELTDIKKQCSMPGVPKIEASDAATEPKTITTDGYCSEEPCTQGGAGNVLEAEGDLAAALEERAIEGESFPAAEMVMQPSTDGHVQLNSKATCQEETDVDTDMEVQPANNLCEEPNENNITGINDNKDNLSKTREPEQEGVSQGKEMVKVAGEPQATVCEAESSQAAEHNREPDIQPPHKEPTEPFIEDQERMDSEQQCVMLDVPEMEAPAAGREAEVISTESLCQDLPVDTKVPCAQDKVDDGQQTEEDLPTKLEKEGIEGNSVQTAERRLQPSTSEQALVETGKTDDEIKAGDFQENERTDIAVEPPKDASEEPNKKDMARIQENKIDIVEPHLAAQPDQESVCKEKELLEVADEAQNTPCPQEEGNYSETAVMVEPHKKAFEEEPGLIDYGVQPCTEERPLEKSKETHKEVNVQDNGVKKIAADAAPLVFDTKETQKDKQEDSSSSSTQLILGKSVPEQKQDEPKLETPSTALYNITEVSKTEDRLNQDQVSETDEVVQPNLREMNIKEGTLPNAMQEFEEIQKPRGYQQQDEEDSTKVNGVQEQDKVTVQETQTTEEDKQEDPRSTPQEDTIKQEIPEKNKVPETTLLECPDKPPEYELKQPAVPFMF